MCNGTVGTKTGVELMYNFKTNADGSVTWLCEAPALKPTVTCGTKITTTCGNGILESGEICESNSDCNPKGGSDYYCAGCNQCLFYDGQHAEL